MRLGYNTNGLAHHRLLDAIDLLADHGFGSVAITLDAGCLDPYEEPAILACQARSGPGRARSARYGPGGRDGARYLLNPRVKHDPTLMDPDPLRRAVRVDFLCRAIDLAAALQAEAVSLWSGRSPLPVGQDEGMDRLVESLKPVLEHAERTKMPLAFEPEPGMFIETLEHFTRLDAMVRHPLFDVTIDVGHIHCTGEGEIAALMRHNGRIRNIHIEDMVPGVHEHLMFGQGTMDFPPIFSALREVEYRGGVHVELSRHSHMAVEAVRRAAAFLEPLMEGPSGKPE